MGLWISSNGEERSEADATSLQSLKASADTVAVSVASSPRPKPVEDSSLPSAKQSVQAPEGLAEEELCERAYRQTTRMITAAMRQSKNPFAKKDAAGRSVPALAVPEHDEFVSDCEEMPLQVRRCWVRDFSEDNKIACREIVTDYFRSLGPQKPNTPGGQHSLAKAAD